VAITTDHAIEAELNTKILQIEEIKKHISILSNSGKTLPQKEKAQLLRIIQTSLQQLSTFLQQTKLTDIHNSGIKFKFENLQEKFLSLNNLWRKTETKL
jgi:hypothetical protein